jgi:hypothetical protein
VTAWSPSIKTSDPPARSTPGRETVRPQPTVWSPR